MYHTILVPLDGSAFSEHALPLALGIARRTGASVLLAHVCVSLAQEYYASELLVPGPSETLNRERFVSYLTGLTENLSRRWELPIRVAMLEGLVADELCAYATSVAADLVVMTTHGYGPLSRMWMGSVADKLVRRLPMPVVLTRPHGEALDLLEEVHEQPFEHVLIPLDGSVLAEEILEPTMALGRPMGARYTLLQAINPPALGYAPAAHAVGLDAQMLAQWRAEAQTYLDQVADRLRGHGHVVDTRIVIGPPAITILDYAHEHAADLIAMATHGRGGVARMLLGSVADKVVRGAGTPVLLRRPAAEAAQPRAAA